MICQVVAYGRLKTKENFKLLALEVVAVAYERWSLTRGSKYSDLTGKLLVFWKTGRSGEVVTYERWSQLEVRLYFGCFCPTDNSIQFLCATRSPKD